jgi:hypothetical protein
MVDAPGGGHLVTVEDPEGFPVNFIWGQAELSEARLQKIEKPKNLVINNEYEKTRKKAFQRFSTGPAEVFKVRLYVFGCKNAI